MATAQLEHDRVTASAASPFDLEADEAYRCWRATKLAQRARTPGELIVEVADPRRLSPAERDALLLRCARWNMALYRGPAAAGADGGLARVVGAQLGLHRLDANWLADEDGVSRITVRRRGSAAQSDAEALMPGASRGEGEVAGAAARGGADFIPYTDRPIQWHTDGYYHPEARRIRAMVLHCVRPAREGGVNSLLDHELAYIALRDASPDAVRALMAPDAMTIPAREGADGGVERAAQSGPVFSVDPCAGALHLRYTARTRSIAWKDDPATRQAVQLLVRLLDGSNPWLLRVRLEAGMGIVANNVLHDRSGFVDDPAAPRLLLRARYLDRIPTLPDGRCPPWGPLRRAGEAGSAPNLG